MSLTKEQVKTAAMQLDPSDRESLAEELLLSLTGEHAAAIDAAWLAEARRRDAAFLRGQTSVRPVDEVIERLKNKARS